MGVGCLLCSKAPLAAYSVNNRAHKSHLCTHAKALALGGMCGLRVHAERGMWGAGHECVAVCVGAKDGPYGRAGMGAGDLTVAPGGSRGSPFSLLKVLRRS